MSSHNHTQNTYESGDATADVRITTADQRQRYRHLSNTHGTPSQRTNFVSGPQLQTDARLATQFRQSHSSQESDMFEVDARSFSSFSSFPSSQPMQASGYTVGSSPINPAYHPEQIGCSITYAHGNTGLRPLADQSIAASTHSSLHLQPYGSNCSPTYSATGSEPVDMHGAVPYSQPLPVNIAPQYGNFQPVPSSLSRYERTHSEFVTDLNTDIVSRAVGVEATLNRSLALAKHPSPRVPAIVPSEVLDSARHAISPEDVDRLINNDLLYHVGSPSLRPFRRRLDRSLAIPASVQPAVTSPSGTRRRASRSPRVRQSHQQPTASKNKGFQVPQHVFDQVTLQDVHKPASSRRSYTAEQREMVNLRRRVGACDFHRKNKKQCRGDDTCKFFHDGSARTLSRSSPVLSLPRNTTSGQPGHIASFSNIGLSDAGPSGVSRMPLSVREPVSDTSMPDASEVDASFTAFPATEISFDKGYGIGAAFHDTSSNLFLPGAINNLQPGTGEQFMPPSLPYQQDSFPALPSDVTSIQDLVRESSSMNPNNAAPIDFVREPGSQNQFANYFPDQNQYAFALCYQPPPEFFPSDAPVFLGRNPAPPHMGLSGPGTAGPTAPGDSQHSFMVDEDEEI